MSRLLIPLFLLLSPTLGAQHYLLPAAGNQAGANGTFFRSDVSIFNPREDNQRVLVQWLPAGRSATDNPQLITVPAFDTLVVDDFVGQVLAKSELGAIVFTAVRQDGQPDPNARLVIRSRIWTPSRGGGTTSQSFDGIPLALINSSSTFVITGQRADDQFRLNVGIVNLDPENEHRFNVIPVPGTQSAVVVRVAPMSMTLVNIPPDPAVARFASILRVHPITGPDPKKWIAFSSSVDNTTGDAWSYIGAAALLP